MAARTPSFFRPLLLAAAIAAVAGAGARPASAEAAKVAVVDVQRAVMQTEDGIRAQGTLKKLFDRRQQELDAKQVELAKAREDIERQARVLSREALQRRMEDWQKRMIDLQTNFVEYNKELQKRQGELTGPIIKKVFAVIARLAKKNGYELVVDKQAVPYVRPDLELTDQVVQLYNTGDAGDAPEEKKEEKKDK